MSQADDGAKPTTAERNDAAVELARIRDEIDALDLRIVALLNERALWGARRAMRSASPAAARSMTRSASARSCSASRWATPVPSRRPTCSRSTAGSSPSPERSRRATGTAMGGTGTADGAVVPGDTLFLPAMSAGSRPDPRVLPASPVTRFAPAPTGDLHLGHLVNALYTWGIARATGGRVVLRIEDHDRQRSRPAFEATLLDDLERLGLAPDEPRSPRSARARRPSASRTPGPIRGRAGSAARTRDRLCLRVLAGHVRCVRGTAGRTWHGMGCPGGCRELGLPEDEGTGLRVAVGAGTERWLDLLAGPVADEPAAAGDLLVRDRQGNWTYAFCVVVDDMRHGIELVIRGRDLLDATPVQLRLARLLGRETPPMFLHHPLVRRSTGEKLSKSEGDTSVRSLLDAGRTPAELFGLAARLAGLTPEATPIEPTSLWVLFA